MKTVVWRQQNADGTITAFYSDGSFAVVNAMTGQVVQQDDAPNPMRAAMFASGETDAAIDSAQKDLSRENARRWDLGSGQKDRELDLRADDIANSYKVNMMNARTQQEQQRATARYQQEQSQLTRDRLQLDRELGMGRLDLDRAGLGMDMVKTSANLTGPDKVFEQFDLNRGYGAMQSTPSFLSSLRSNTQMPGFVAPGGAPTPASVGGLMAKMQPGYAQSAEGQTIQNARNTIRDIGTAGAHKIGAGVLEGLNDDELKALGSGLGKEGFSPSTFLSDWRRSRIGQGLGASRAA